MLLLASLLFLLILASIALTLIYLVSRLLFKSGLSYKAWERVEEKTHLLAVNATLLAAKSQNKELKELSREVEEIHATIHETVVKMQTKRWL